MKICLPVLWERGVTFSEGSCIICPEGKTDQGQEDCKMKYTSAEAAKLLRKLNEEKDALELEEQRSYVFTASLEEEAESLRPEYDYRQMQEKIDRLDEQIRRVKHAINCFNIRQTVPGFDMSIDQVLIYIPQLSRKKQKLSMMKNRLPKQRERADGFGRSSSIIDYSYANYDIQTVKEDYEKAAEELAKAQTELDLVNNTETMEIDL